MMSGKERKNVGQHEKPDLDNIPKERRHWYAQLRPPSLLPPFIFTMPLLRQ